MSDKRQTYCIVSPVRDEEKYVRRTLDSVVNQTVPPDLWVIVDDGSTDATPQILADYAARYPFIRVIQRQNRGMRRVGGGVVEAFYEGWAVAEPYNHDFLTKLDMDLELPLGYFERLLELMAADPRLGTVSGKAYYPGPSNTNESFEGELISEHIGDDVSLGMTKFWRRECFDEIGGLVPQVLWDGIDCYKARMLGWKAYSVDEPGLRFLHLRPMGSSDKNIIKGRVRLGTGQWMMGSSPVFVLASAVHRSRHRPFVIGALATLWGWAKAGLTGQPRIGDPRFRKHLRGYQWSFMMRGRYGAMRRADAEGESRWKSTHPGRRAS
jgi:biofilm PGA synthesis N-glycosyltransferase PgaC